MSGIDTIKYHTWPRIPYGKVTNTQENITYRSARESALSQQVTKRLHDTDKTIYEGRAISSDNDPISLGCVSILCTC